MDHTLKLDIPDDVYRPLLERAKQAGRTPEETAIYCLTAAFAGPQRLSPADPLLELAGSVESEVIDVAERHDYYLGQQLMKELHSGKNE